jgi:hypothetical protein
MEQRTISETAAVAAPPRRWPFFILGILLFFLGPAISAVQFSVGNLSMPWHLPVLASLGVLLMMASVWRRGGVARWVGMLLFVAVCGLEWFVLLVATKAPSYTGPAQPGRKVPEFVTALADGRPFSNKDLEDGTSRVLLFFRGRW